MNEGRPEFFIFQEIDKVDLKDKDQVMKFIDKTFDKLNSGYDGTRKPLEDALSKEQEAKISISQAKLDKFDKIVDLIDIHYDISPEQIRIKGILFKFHKTALDILDAPLHLEELIKQLDKEIREAVEKIGTHPLASESTPKLYTKILQLADKIHKDKSKKIDDKVYELGQFIYDLKTLNLLLVNMICLEKYYIKEKNHSPKPPKDQVIRNINKYIEFCLKDFIEDKINMKELIYKLWTHMEQVHSGMIQVKKNTKLFSMESYNPLSIRFRPVKLKPTLCKIIEDHIINVFRLATAAKELKDELSPKSEAKKDGPS